MTAQFVVVKHVGDTKLITNFSIEFVVFGTTSKLESHVPTVHPRKTLADIHSFILLVSTYSIGKIGSDKRKKRNVVRCFHAILHDYRKLEVIVGDFIIVILGTSLGIINTGLKENRT